MVAPTLVSTRAGSDDHGSLPKLPQMMTRIIIRAMMAAIVTMAMVTGSGESGRGKCDTQTGDVWLMWKWNAQMLHTNVLIMSDSKMQRQILDTVLAQGDLRRSYNHLQCTMEGRHHTIRF